MKPLSKQEKDKILSRIYWDADVDLKYLYDLIERNLKGFESEKEINFYRRLLLSCDWYTLLKLIPLENFKLILSDTVLNRLYPKSVKEKFLYAREVLFE